MCARCTDWKRIWQRAALSRRSAGASEINRCTYCIHVDRDARTGDETEQRIYSLVAWREALVKPNGNGVARTASLAWDRDFDDDYR